jgi:hypothetical protein
MRSTSSFRIFLSLVVMLGTLGFLRASAGGGCPNGQYPDKQGYCVRYGEDDNNRPRVCSGPCDACDLKRHANFGEQGGLCKTCGALEVCIYCKQKLGCVDPNAPAATTTGTLKGTPPSLPYHPIHKLKITPTSP